jgi:acyl-CoA dehydrogenase
MSDFIQDAPQPSNRFRTDPTLQLTLERLLPREVFHAASPALDRMGERAAYEMPPLADQAEHNKPEHVPYDAWGRRTDEIRIDAAWLRLMRIGQEEGLVALPYEGDYGAHSRIVQAGLVNLYDPVSAVADCPLVMTDGAVRLLLNHDPELAARYVPRLTARQDAWTSGQWMTEKQGGSDVGRSDTIARQDAEGQWRLHGTKWFTSATICDIALVLARPEGAELGSRGLSLFLLELREPDGQWNGLQVRRLKDKFGTRALPTAEMDLVGTRAVPVAGIGRGVSKIADVLNIARLWASWGGTAGVGHLLGLARDYAGRREVFGRRLIETPLHCVWLARIAAEYEAMINLTFETAGVLGRVEHGADATLARVLVPLNKLACARQGVWAASELIESFGGAGYLEDTGLPRIFRNLHVNCIWEGTTSVLAHDVVRVLSSSAAGEAFIESVVRRLEGLTSDALRQVRASVEDALDTLAPLIQSPDGVQARRLAWGMVRTYQTVLLAEAAEWRWREKHDRSAWAAAHLFAREPLVPPPFADLHDDALHALAFGASVLTAGPTDAPMPFLPH